MSTIVLTYIKVNLALNCFPGRTTYVRPISKIIGSLPTFMLIFPQEISRVNS